MPKVVQMEGKLPGTCSKHSARWVIYDRGKREQLHPIENGLKEVMMKQSIHLPGSNFLCVLLVTLLAASSCCNPALNHSSSDLNRDPKTLVVTLYSNPTDFDPASNSEQLANLILHTTCEGLVRATDNPDVFEPVLAERWEHNDDYTVWIFHLRQNVKFHDGTPVTADEVKFSFARLVNIDLGLSYILAQFIDDPENQMVVRDEHTLEFHFDRPTPLLLNALSSSYGSYVISSKAIREHEVNGDMAHEWLQNNEAGSGPYMMTELSPNQRVVLTRFDDWWGWDDGFHFDVVLLKIIPERASRRSMIERGDVDIAFNFGPEDWDSMRENPNLSVHISDGFTIHYIIMGEYGPLSDPRVRQALSYAFDYDGYVTGVWKGYAQQARGPFAHLLQCHDPNTFVYETDLDKARQLLREAGVAEGLELRYWAEEGGGDMGVGQILQAQLAQIGIRLKVEERDTSSFASMYFSDAPWPERPDLMSWYWWPDYNDPTDMAWVNFHTDAWGSQGANAGFYSNERVDEIIDQAATTLDEAELCGLYSEFQDIVTRQDPPWIYLVEWPDEVVMRNDIEGYTAIPQYRQTFRFHELYRVGY